MTCLGCKANIERVALGYSWVSEKVSPMYKCTCSKKEKLFDEIIGWCKLIFILPLLGIVLLCSPLFWVMDRIDEEWIKDSYDND